MTESQLVLRGLDSAAAQILWADLQALRGAPLIVDASCIEAGGTPGMQVLVSAAKTWAADTFDFHIVHPSEAFREALQTLGILPGQLNIQTGS